MKQQKIISREYKLVLKTENFSENDADLLIAAKAFWESFKELVKPGMKMKGSLDRITANREIRFYDTKELLLLKQGYIFRERKDISGGKMEVTLKFRHPDRYVSQDRDMRVRKIDKGETKFEEDIKAPFQILYSFSSTQSIDKNDEINKLKHISNLYPGFYERLERNSDKEKVFIVNDLTVRELVITGSEMILCEDPNVKAECALIIWYDLKQAKGKPIIAEFSFRYGNKKGRYSEAASKKAFDTFKIMQSHMTSWIDSNNPTKTGFVYQK